MSRTISILEALFGKAEVRTDPVKAVQRVRVAAQNLIRKVEDEGERERVRNIADSTAWTKLSQAIPAADCVTLFERLVAGPSVYERRRLRPRVLPRRGIALAEKLAEAIRGSETVPALTEAQRDILLKFLDLVTSGRKPVYSVLTGALPERPNRPTAGRTFVCRLVKGTLAQYTEEPMREAVADLAAAALDGEEVPTANTIRKTRKPKVAL